jgi:Zn-dependent protease
MVGGAVVLLWKLKFVVVFALTKLKLLLLGFSKMGTLLSMLATMGVYWAMWGWPFAVGFVLSIYVHEMGHVSALRHYGIRASAPMFIPFVGAFVRLKESLHGDWENAMVGLAGPLWGFGAAIVSYGLYFATAEPIFAAIAHTGAWINLFNLLPVWQLDGGRGFSAMSRNHRLLAAGATLAAFAVTRDGMLLLVGLVGLGMAFVKKSSQPDARIAAYYVAILWALAAVSALSHSAALGALQATR